MIVKTKSNTYWLLWTSLVFSSCLATSCMTTYDAYGRPVQSVDPGAATAGIAAAGVLGYALGNSHDDHHRHHNYYRRGYYHHGYYR